MFCLCVLLFLISFSRQCEEHQDNSNNDQHDSDKPFYRRITPVSMAVNAFTFPVDHDTLLAPLRQLYESVNDTLNANPALTQGGHSVNVAFEYNDGHSFFVTSYGTNDCRSI
jgi:hypothetical protein